MPLTSPCASLWAWFEALGGAPPIFAPWRVDNSQRSQDSEYQSQKGQCGELQRRALVLIQADHHLSQDKNQGGVHNECEPETMLAKVFDETLEELQDNKESKEASHREAKGFFEIVSGHDFPCLQEQPEDADSQDKDDEEDQGFEKEIHDPVEKAHGIETL